MQGRTSEGMQRVIPANAGTLVSKLQDMTRAYRDGRAGSAMRYPDRAFTASRCIARAVSKTSSISISIGSVIRCVFDTT